MFYQHIIMLEMLSPWNSTFEGLCVSVKICFSFVRLKMSNNVCSTGSARGFSILDAYKHLCVLGQPCAIDQCVGFERHIQRAPRYV